MVKNKKAIGWILVAIGTFLIINALKDKIDQITTNLPTNNNIKLIIGITIIIIGIAIFKYKPWK